MGCCGGGHNRQHNQMKSTKAYGENHSQHGSTNDGTSKMMIVFGLIVLGSLAYYFLR